MQSKILKVHFIFDLKGQGHYHQACIFIDPVVNPDLTANYPQGSLFV